MDGRKHRQDGAMSRRAILEAAAAIASVRGLDGLSIADVARAVEMSKGGVYAHFDSKEALQLATIDMASEIFAREVLVPAAQAGQGVAHLRALCDEDLDYVRRRVFPGGCFFSAVAAEYCGRQGPVKDHIAAANRGWIAHLVGVIDESKLRGELSAECDAEALAFELNALMVSANFEFNLIGEPDVLDRASQLMERAITRGASSL